MVIKCKSNKCLLIHVCSPNLITFCLFMRLLGGWGYPGPAAGLRRPVLGRGLFGDTVSPGGHKPTRVEKQLPRGPSRLLAERGCPCRCSRARAPRARSAPRTPLLTAGLPRAWRAHRLQPVLCLIFTAGRLKNSLAIPPRGSFCFF